MLGFFSESYNGSCFVKTSVGFFVLYVHFSKILIIKYHIADTTWVNQKMISKIPFEATEELLQNDVRNYAVWYLIKKEIQISGRNHNLFMYQPKVWYHVSIILIF